MKLSLFTVAGLVAVISAQTAPNLPQCGTNTMITAVSSSGCAFTDASCICKNQSILTAAKTGLPKACTSAADQKSFADFFNTQCTGQPGFPISIGSAAAASPPTNNAVRPSGAMASGAPKPSSVQAGASAAKPSSEAHVMQASIGALGAAVGVALLLA